MFKVQGSIQDNRLKVPITQSLTETYSSNSLPRNFRNKMKTLFKKKKKSENKEFEVGISLTTVKRKDQ